MQEKVKDGGTSEFKYVGTRAVRPDGVDKVTGRARFGADLAMQGQLVGRVLRSPHAHARIKSIDISEAAALPGVKAIVTRDDFKDQPSEFIPAGEMMINYRDVVRSVMAREKALYEGHAVAAVAATSAAVAEEALGLIKVDYEVLPHVIDVRRGHAARRADPARGHDHRRRGAGAQGGLQRRQAHRVRARRHRGGFRPGRSRRRAFLHHQPVHQGYIEPHDASPVSRRTARPTSGAPRRAHWIVRAQVPACSAGHVGKVASGR